MADLYWPFDPSIITEGYGWAAWRNGLHDGIDFGVRQGTVIRATAAGVIRNVDAGSTDGAGVDLMTDDGWKVRHWHVSKFLLPPGTRVNAGDDIALSGGIPGTWGAGNTTGAHMHWGVATNGSNNWVDPASLNPQNFDQPTPQPKEEEDMAQGAFYRIQDGDTGGGSIYWQEKPNTVLIPVSLATWIAYSTQGNKYANLSAKDVNALITKYGTAATPPAGSGGTVNVPDFKITMSGEAVKK